MAGQVMVDPRRVFELGIHHMSRPAGGAADCPVLEVDPRDAYVRHYRQCVRDFDAQMDCSRQCLDADLVTTSAVVATTSCYKTKTSNIKQVCVGVNRTGVKFSSTS